MSAHPTQCRRLAAAQRTTAGHFLPHAQQKSWFRAILVQADALLINQIAPGSRTLVPSA
jgi:hypothetical protein